MSRIPASAFRRVALYASVELHDSASFEVAAGLDNLLQAAVLGAHRILGAPDSVLPKGEPTVTWHNADVPLDLVAYRDGHIRRLSRQPAWAAGPAALMSRALDSIDTRAYIGWSANTPPDSVVFDFAFSRPILDSLGAVTPPHPTRTAIPLLSVEEPWERGVVEIPNQRPPYYPLGAERSHYEGTVVLQFLVDATGRALQSTIHDLWPEDKPRLRGTDLYAYQAFVQQSTEKVKELRFIPASVGGCPVSQLVKMPFVYSFNR